MLSFKCNIDYWPVEYTAQDGSLVYLAEHEPARIFFGTDDSKTIVGDVKAWKTFQVEMISL